MKGLIRWCIGYLLVEISGYGQERLLNLCGHHGIGLWEVVCRNGIYRCCVLRTDFKQMTALVRKSRSRLIVREKHGFPWMLHRHKRRKWFVAGIPLCLILLYVFSLHIWRMEFDGNSYFTDELLKKTLKEQGYETGMRKSEILCDELEMMLRETYPEITWVSAQINGTGLYIQIRENKEIMSVEEETSIPCDLVASCDGVITSMITRSGTPLVKQGDTVSAGQVLVRGIVELYNDSKEKTGEHKVAADADVLATTVISYEDNIAMEYPVKWYTGEKRYQPVLQLGERRISLDLSGGRDGTWETLYDSVTMYGHLSLGSQMELPVTWQITTLREYEETQAIYSKEQAVSLAEENCARFFEKLLEKGVQIIEKNVRIDNMGDECVASGTVTVIQSIGQSVPIVENLDVQEETSN